MAATFMLGTTCRNGAGDGVVDAVDGGTPPGRLEHRTSTLETNVNDASNGTLLGTNLFSNPAFGNTATGVATASAISNDSSADASGTAGHFRVYTGAGGDTAALFQGNSGTASTTLIFDNNVIVSGGVIAISAFTVTIPVQ